MLDYLLRKARRAGHIAYIENNSVTVKLPIIFLGKEISSTTVSITNIQQYNNLLGV